MFWLCHVVKQKFQDEGAAKASAFNLELGKAGGGVNVLNVVDSDEARIFHGVGKAVAVLCAWRSADVILAVFTQVFSTYVLVAFFAVGAAKPAAFIAEKFHLLLLCVGQCA